MGIFTAEPEPYLYLVSWEPARVEDIHLRVSQYPISFDLTARGVVFPGGIETLTISLLSAQEAGELSREQLQQLSINSSTPPPTTIIRAEWGSEPEYPQGMYLAILLDLCWMMKQSSRFAQIVTPSGAVVEPEEPVQDWAKVVIEGAFPRFTVEGGDKPASASPPKEAHREGALQLPAVAFGIVIRTDFDNEAAWNDVKAELLRPQIDPHSRQEFPPPFLEYIDDSANERLSVEQLVTDFGRGIEDRLAAPTYVYLADEATMTHPEHPLLALRLYIEPGQTFRVALSAMSMTDMNLSIANMDFEDYMGSLDHDGIHRGF